MPRSEFDTDAGKFRLDLAGSAVEGGLWDLRVSELRRDVAKHLFSALDQEIEQGTQTLMKLRARVDSFKESQKLE